MNESPQFKSGELPDTVNQEELLNSILNLSQELIDFTPKVEAFPDGENFFTEKIFTKSIYMTYVTNA